MSAWNLKDEHLKKVSTSYTKGGRTAPLYFTKTGADFAAETTIQYTTTFTEDESIYQPDLMGGFTFHDGKTKAFLMAKKDGFVYTGYKNVYGLIKNKALMYPDKRSVKLGVAKVGDKVSVYLNDNLVKTMDWATVAPKINAKSQLAIGFYMLADKTADIAFTNYSLKTGTTAAKKYIANHKKADVSIPGSSLFAQSVTVGGKQLYSMADFWNLSDVANGNVMGSYALKTKGKVLYFNTHGSTILAESTIAYTTDFKTGEEYQKDLMGGFYLTDGENKGWVVANQTGVTYTGWNRDRGLIPYSVLTYDGKTPPRSVKMTMAVQGKYIYIFFDENCIWKQKLNVVVPGVKEGADLAVGLYMVTDKAADIKFSNISIMTNAGTVQNYINGHTKSSSGLPAAALTTTQMNYAKLLGQGMITNNKLEVLGKVSPGNNTTLFIGDSFFDRRNYWTDFYESYVGKDVFLAGIASTRADQWKDILADEILTVFGNKAPKNIVIHIGTNDIHDGGYSAGRVQDNLTGLFTMLHERYPQAKIYYFGITHRARNPVYKDNVVNSFIAEWCTARDYITYIDTPSLITTDMLKDGIHPKLEYYSIFMEQLEKAGCVIENK